VLDDWVVWWRSQHATGDVVIVRYADDFVMGFQYKHEAERFLRALRGRLQAFALNLHPEKTRLIEFGRFAAQNRRERGEGRPETFNFLGFTHICATTWKNKRFKIARKTISKRMTEAVKRIGRILLSRMHDEIAETGQWLQRVLRGYFQYFAVPGNTKTLVAFRHAIMRVWLKALRRRSDKRKISWDTFSKNAECWAPVPTPLHPYPDVRFCAKHS